MARSIAHKLAYRIVLISVILSDHFNDEAQSILKIIPYAILSFDFLQENPALWYEKIKSSKRFKVFLACLFFNTIVSEQISVILRKENYSSNDHSFLVSAVTTRVHLLQDWRTTPIINIRPAT